MHNWINKVVKCAESCDLSYFLHCQIWICDELIKKRTDPHKHLRQFMGRRKKQFSNKSYSLTTKPSRLLLGTWRHTKVNCLSTKPLMRTGKHPFSTTQSFFNFLILSFHFHWHLPKSFGNLAIIIWQSCLLLNVLS